MTSEISIKMVTNIAIAYPNLTRNRYYPSNLIRQHYEPGVTDEQRIKAIADSAAIVSALYPWFMSLKRGKANVLKGCDAMVIRYYLDHSPFNKGTGVITTGLVACSAILAGFEPIFSNNSVEYPSFKIYRHDINKLIRVSNTPRLNPDMLRDLF